MNGFYFHPRRVFELYISRPVYLAVCEVLLYNARFAPACQDGVQIKPGQLLIKKSEIADMCGISLSQVRSALDCFVRDGGIAVTSCGKKGMLITILPPFSAVSENKPKPSYSTYKKEPYSRKSNDTYTPDPNASYDLKRAEERARQQVPKLRKRP